MNYPIKSFNSNNGIVVMDFDAGKFEVEILRDELSPQWAIETFLCKIKEPFVLYDGKSEAYHTEFNYVVFQCSIGSDRVESSSEQLFQKAKEANKNYLEKLSRLNAD